ncbi:redoxin domain-containing protein [Modestobacter sp. NPDC049651]|uniref:redoxin domain-containing protein n=1 Tax=unclassified Modestobacter TaxID=2643866 RepID=UPI0033D62948
MTRTAPPGVRMPELDGATGWLNTPPLTTAALRGRVVLVGFWTYTCINWRRTLPHLRAWAVKYADAGLVVLGVHSPEFGFEGDPANVRQQVADLGIGYPVALDARHEVWSAFANHWWPALYFVDATGRIREQQVGEGGFAEAELVLRRLLAEAGGALPDEPLVRVEATGAELPADWDTLMSGETYLGTDRTTDFASSPHLAVDEPVRYTPPHRLRLNTWALAGTWRVGREAAVAVGPGSSLAHHFRARDLHLVAGPPGADRPVRFRVTLDGRPPGPDAGVDVGPDGAGVLSTPRMHHLVRQHGAVAQRRFEITFLDPGAHGYVLTFG